MIILIGTWHSLIPGTLGTTEIKLPGTPTEEASCSEESAKPYSPATEVPSVQFDQLVNHAVKPGETIQFYLMVNEAETCELEVVLDCYDPNALSFDPSSHLVTFTASKTLEEPVNARVRLETATGSREKIMSFVPESDTPARNTEVFGFTQGNHRIDESGGFQYGLQIAAPPGPGGISPQLSLSYSSQASDGIMGLGWSLGGLSTIGKSPSFIALDDKIRGIKNDGEDQFNLDGLRLLAIDGNTTGGSGSEYRTESNHFSRIFSNTTSTNRVDSWKVQTKTGLTYEYGNTDNSFINSGNDRALFWAVNKITDTNGNYIEFLYNNSEGTNSLEFSPMEIKYGANDAAGVGHSAFIRFGYEARPDVKRQYINGLAITNSTRLKTISVYNGSQLLRTYNLEYHTIDDKNTFSKLKSITESGSEGGQFRPINFSWVENTDPKLNLVGEFVERSRLKNNKVFPLDYNQDGLLDVVTINTNGTQTHIYLNEGNRLTLSSESFNTLKGDGTFIEGDYNGDGRTDLFWFDKTQANSRFFLAKATGGFEVGISTTTDEFFTNTSINELYAVDGNGDGFTDFIRYDTEKKATSWLKNESTGGNFNPLFDRASDNIENDDVPDKTQLFVNDFNNDGLADVMLINIDEGFSEYYENTTESGNSASVFTFSDPITPFFSDDLQKDRSIYFGNWNGDNLIDAALINIKNGENVFLLNDGDGIFEDSDNPISKSTLDMDNLQIYPVDWNGDGFTDIVTYQTTTGINKFLLNQGDFKFTERSELSIPQGEINDGNGLAFGDWTGNGTMSAFWYRLDNGNNRLYLSNLTNDNLINKVEDGSGQELNVTYATLRDSTVYSSANDAVYPLIDFRGALSVVKSYNLKNGRGGTNSFSYKYENGKVHVLGRGFRGFEKIELTDDQTGIKNVSVFNRDFEQVGAQKTLEAQISSSGDTLSAVYLTNGSRLIDGTHFSFVEKQVMKEFELNGALFSTITQTMEYDDDGNVTAIDIDYGDQTIDRTLTEYESFTDDDKWILGRLTKNSLRRQEKGRGFSQRVASFEYDSQTGLLSKEIVEPDNSELEIETSYTRDAFGNIIQTDVKGNDGYSDVTRTTTYEFDATGRYILKTTNPLGHSRERTYNSTWGFIEQQKDANGLITSWEYDEFGRKTKENRADGTTLSKTYQWCSGDCPTYAVYYTSTEESGAATSYVYFDLLGREVRSTTQGFDGTNIHIDKGYDNNGNLERQSEPYFEGESPIYTTYRYDDKQRPIDIKQPGARSTTMAYSGFITTTTNSEGQQIRVVTDALDRIQQSSNDLGATVSYTYDAFGNLIQTQDVEGNTIKWTYDRLGRTTSLDDPDIGLETYEYNSFGEMIKKINAREQETTYKLDKLGRTIERTDPEGTTTWTYDTGTGAIGKMSKVESPHVDTEISYDEFGRMVDKQKTVDGETLNFGISYDAVSRPLKLTYPQGFSLDHEYNERGFLQEIKHDGNSIWKLEKLNARGQAELQAYGNGSQIEKVFEEETGWVREIKAFSSDTTFQSMAFAYTKLGNLQSRENRMRQLRETFEYDRLNRLTFARVDGHEAMQMSYDQLGNLTFKSDIGKMEYGEGEAGPHALTSIDGSDVENWSLARSLDNMIEYGSFQKATALSNDTARINLYYDDVYQRVKVEKRVNGLLVNTKLYFDHWFQMEKENGKTTYTFNVRAMDGVVAQYTQSDTENEFKYWYKDHLGSLETVADQDLKEFASFSYDAWGRRRDPTNWISYEFDYSKLLARGFTGHEHYDLLSMIDMNGRLYDPVLGRFTSPDPFIQDLTNILAFNRYSYALNNPLSLTDPTGYFFKSVFRRVKKVFKRVVKTAKKVVKAVTTFVKQKAKVIIPVAIGIVTGGIGGLIAPAFGLSAAVGSAAGYGFGFAASSSLLAGASLSDALKNGVRAGLTAGITKYGGFDRIFNQVKEIDNFALRTLAHGTVQGVKAELSGGEFSTAFITDLGGTAKMAIEHIPSKIGQLTANVLVEGTVSDLTGDKFRNGAISAAMMYLHNEPNILGLTEDDEGTLVYEIANFFKQHIDWSIDGDGNLVAFGDFGSLIGGVTYNPYNNQVLEGEVMGAASFQSIPLIGRVLKGYVLASRKYSIEKGKQTQVFTTGCLIAVCFEGAYDRKEGGSNE